MKYPFKDKAIKKMCPNCLNDFKTHHRARFCSQVCKNAHHYKKRAQLAEVGRKALAGEKIT